MKYKNSRKLCWEKLTDSIKVRLDGKYTIEADDFHNIKKVFFQHRRKLTSPIKRAVKTVDKKMDLNPTIPLEARSQLIIEQYHKYDKTADDYWEALLKEEL